MVVAAVVESVTALVDGDVSVAVVVPGASVAAGSDESSLEHPAITAAVAPAPAIRKRRRPRRATGDDSSDCIAPL